MAAGTGVRVSALDALPGDAIADDDEFYVVDTSANASRKATGAQLRHGLTTDAQLAALAARVAALEQAGMMGDHTRRVLVSPDANLDMSDLSSQSNTNMITVPGTALTWPDGDLRYIFVGVPVAEADISNILSGGIGTIGAYVRHPVDYDGHKWWRTIDMQDGEFSRGEVLQIEQ